MDVLTKLANSTLLADGATGTYLQSRGLEAGGDPELMNLTHASIVKGMAQDYFEAGCDLVQTNSFGGNFFVQSRYNQGANIDEINFQAAQLAKSGSLNPNFVKKERYVFGSVGPTGELIEPVGTTSAKDVYAAFKQQILALEKGGVDGIIIETMISLDEAKIAISAAKEHTELPVAALTTFDKGPRGFFTMMGDTPEKCFTELFSADADIVGANCGNGIEIMSELAKRFRECGEGNVWINSNAGIPEIRQGQIIYPETPDYMSEGFSKLIDMGINIVGGCCGTTPAHIKHVANLINEKKGD